MQEYINQLKTKPKAHKQRVSFLVSGGFTLLVLIIWTIVMTTGPKPVAKETTGTVNLASVGTLDTSPFSSIWGDIRSTWSDLVNSDGQ